MFPTRRSDRRRLSEGRPAVPGHRALRSGHPFHRWLLPGDGKSRRMRTHRQDRVEFPRRESKRRCVHRRSRGNRWRWGGGWRGGAPAWGGGGGLGGGGPGRGGGGGGGGGGGRGRVGE